jgi:hypothetical protein
VNPDTEQISLRPGEPTELLQPPVNSAPSVHWTPSSHTRHLHSRNDILDGSSPRGDAVGITITGCVSVIVAKVGIG